MGFRYNIIIKIVEVLIEGKYQDDENAMELHRQKVHDCKIVFEETVLENFKNPYLMAEPRYSGELVSGVLTDEKTEPKSKAPKGMSPSYYHLLKNNRKLKRNF